MDNSPFAPLRPPIMPPLSPLDNILLLDPVFNHLLPPSFSVLDFPPSPSDTCSSISADSSPSSPPDTVRVVCDVPLLAPRPLPYHSPTFLQFELPDTDEDLSHPPYTHRPSKRKRDADDDPAISQSQSKRRPGIHRRLSRIVHRPWDHPSPHLSHRSGNHRSRT
ncbi:hypothetical protein J3R83DRAFT_1788 [Lanmaoa asiatica]|nr:hypothetical protein J3R83DRAFT_1788 [Lanmaoa asiatica]